MDDDDSIPISALQHYLFCPRQCALIHVEQQWQESGLTAQGRLLHERADKPGTAKRSGVRVLQALALVQRDVGIHGVADVVEFHRTAEGEVPYAVEYKRGRPKEHRADEVQLCAQVMCLESMYGHQITEGALFYGATRRRQVVVMDDGLRALTLEIVEAVRAQRRDGVTPRAVYLAKRCDACSLLDLCQPHVMGRAEPVSAWLAHMLKE